MLNVKLKNFQGSTGECLWNVELSKEFKDLTLRARFIKEKQDKSDLIKISDFCCVKVHKHKVTEDKNDKLQTGKNTCGT